MAGDHTVQWLDDHTVVVNGIQLKLSQGYPTEGERMWFAVHIIRTIEKHDAECPDCGGNHGG